MEHLNATDCQCKGSPSPQKTVEFRPGVYLCLLAVAAICWWFLFERLEPLSDWAAFQVMGFAPSSRIGAAVQFFIYDIAKIFMLLTGIVYAIAWVRISMSVEKLRDYLAGKNKAAGYFFAAIFGAITPFCSCSSIPLFIGFTTARIPIGITMSFLFSSPLVDPVSFGLLWGLVGWKFTVIYAVVGTLAGVLAGLVLDYLKADRWLQPFLLNATAGYTPAADATEERLSIAMRHAFAYNEMKDIFSRVWLWVVLGVGIGAGLHGYMPQDWIAGTLGKAQWWSVPLAVTVGIPLYTNTVGLLPVMESLLLKGLPVGTTLALCMSTIVVSLPEIMMLKQVMRWQLLALFLALCLVIFTLIGWLFNAISFAII